MQFINKKKLIKNPLKKRQNSFEIRRNKNIFKFLENFSGPLSLQQVNIHPYA